jgi:cytochrome c oxidase assembly protein subunit 15
LKNLHLFALFTAFCTFVLIIAGGLVTSTGSGLSVPDWPNTYGHFMFAYPLDQMVGGIFYEHSHRMIASFVGFLTVILALWIWKKDERRWMKILGFAALSTVIAQGVLGGLTVLFLLPTPISVTHATVAQSFFSIVIAIALFTSQWWRAEHPQYLEQGRKISVHRLTLFATSAVFIQLILGALMRHTQSGLAVPDFPLAYGQIFPLLSPENLQRYNDQLIAMNIRVAADGAITSSQIIIHLLHRFWALVVTVLVCWSSVRLIKLSHVSPRLKRLGLLLLWLIVLQITLGALTVLSQKAVDVTTAHVATGALFLALNVLSVLHVRKLIAQPVREQAFSYSSSAKEVTV